MKRYWSECYKFVFFINTQMKSPCVLCNFLKFKVRFKKRKKLNVKETNHKYIKCEDITKVQNLIKACKKECRVIEVNATILFINLVFFNYDNSKFL